MFRAIRRQLNPATAMAFLALVFAMTGGAFAVTGRGAGPSAIASKSKAKPKGKPGPRGLVGPKGETGAAGATGPAGAKGEAGPVGPRGETGAAGTDGTSGKDGESVVSAALTPGEGGCAEGGSKFTVGGKETMACNGEKGERGESGSAGSFPEKLPEGATETGVGVATFTSESENLAVPISFPIQLPIAVENFHYVSNEAQENHTVPSQCSGSSEKPTAAQGNLCVYEAGGLTGKFGVTGAVGPDPGGDSFGTNVAGALLITSLEKGAPSGEAIQFVWAVSAP
jgi:hypothetical protein